MEKYIQELTASSKRIPQPADINVKLKDHQLAMIFKCLEMERMENKINFLADKPGSGKTYAILGLILSNKIINETIE